jgi:hypothetical protein
MIFFESWGNFIFSRSIFPGEGFLGRFLGFQGVLFRQTFILLLKNLTIPQALHMFFL